MLVRLSRFCFFADTVKKYANAATLMEKKGCLSGDKGYFNNAERIR